MPINPDHKPEPTELYENPEGERGRESGTPEKLQTRPEDLPQKVDAGIQAVEANLKIVPTAFGEASKHFGVPPENLVVEPDASELAASRQQLDSAGHQMHDLATALSGTNQATEPTLLRTEPQMSPVAGAPYEPAQLPVDTGPRVDGVRTPIATAPEQLNEAEEAFFKAGETANGTGVIDYSGYSKEALQSQREAINKELDDTDMLVGQKDEHGKVITQDRIDDLHRQQEAIVKALGKESIDGVRPAQPDKGRPIQTEPESRIDPKVEVRNAEIGRQINSVFEERSKAGAGEEAKKPALFDVGTMINLPKHLSTANEAKWRVAKIVNGTYLLEQKNKNGEQQFLVTDEKELATQGISNNSYTKEYNDFRNAVFETKAKAAKTPPTESLDNQKPLKIKVSETVKLPPELLAEKKIRSDDPVWNVSANEAGVFLLSQTDKFGNTAQIVVNESELRKNDVDTSKPKSEKEIAEKKIDLKALSLDQLNALWEDVTFELNTPRPGEMSPAKQYGSTRKELNLVLREIKRIRPEKEREAAENPKNETDKVERKPSQDEYYRAIHEAAIQKVLQEARNNPADYAKLAGSVVGATMRYTADGGASLVDRQGQVLKELGKNKVDEARLAILKDRIVPSLLREGTKMNEGFLSELKAKREEISTIDSSQPDAENRLRTLRQETADLEENISQIQTWMQDLQSGKGDFSLNVDGRIQVTSPVEGMNLVVDEKAVKVQENILALQTEKLFAARTAIKELAESKVVPEALKADIQQGNFSFTVTDDMTMTVEVVGGKNDGSRFQVQPKITEDILSGSLPKGDATPNLADLQKQTAPDKAKPADNATEDEEDTNKPKEVKANSKTKVEQKEKSESTPLSIASYAMHQHILDLGVSEWQDQVKPLIENMKRDGAELAIRADNKGNLYAGVMSADGKHMVRRLEPRIEANSEVGRILNSDPSMGVLRRLEHTVKEEEPKKEAQQAA